MVEFSLDDECCFIGLIRVIAFFPACALGHYALRSWILVRGVAELDSSYYKPYIEETQQLAAILGVAIAAWTGLGFVYSVVLLSRPAHQIRSFLHLEIGGVVDAICAVGFAVAAGLQSNYLPTARSTCNQALTWGASDTHRGLFDVLSEVNHKSASSICHNFVDAWSLSIAIIIFSLMLAWIGILSRVKEGKHVWIAIVPFVILAYTFLGVCWLLRCPIESLKYLYRFIRRRTWRTPEKETQLAIREKARYAPLTWAQVYAPRNSKLQAVLSIEHILLPIARELHYADLVNLSLTCKSMREVVFPTFDKKIRTQKLKTASCNGMFKQNCFCCNIVTCMAPLTNTRYGQAAYHFSLLSNCQGDTTNIEPSSHFRLCSSPHCRPQCSWCAYKSLNRFWRSRTTCAACNATGPARAICKPCGQLSRPDLLRRLKLRHKAEMARMTKPEGYLRCVDCKRKFGGEWPRFWCCQACRRQCELEVHPAWVRRNAEEGIMGEV